MHGTHTFIDIQIYMCTHTKNSISTHTHTGTYTHALTHTHARTHTQPLSIPFFTHTTCHMVWFPDVSYWNNNIFPAHLSSLHRHFSDSQNHMEWAGEFLVHSSDERVTYGSVTPPVQYCMLCTNMFCWFLKCTTAINWKGKEKEGRNSPKLSMAVTGSSRHLCFT